MIPILYKHNETQFRTQGLGRLVDCISCEVTEERNGIFECEFTYPITGALYDKIKEGCIIYTTHDNTKTPQPFDIYKRTAPIDGIVTFYASHISYRLNSIIAKPFSAVSCSQALSFFATNSVNDNPFTFWTDKQVSAPFAFDVPSNIREKLCGEAGSILDVYGTGEYKFDKFAVNLYLNRGTDTDVSIRYGKNLIDITNEIDISGLYNAVAPFWKNEAGDVVTLPEWYIYDSNAPLELDNWENEYLEPITDENGTAIDFGVFVPNIAALDLSDEFEEQPTVEDLRDKAASRLAGSNAWLPRQNIEIDFVQLWDTLEYGNLANIERLNLCDTAMVVYDALGVNVRQKVIKTVYNSLLDKYNSMELGSARQTFAEAIEDMLSGIVFNNYARKSAVSAAVERATDIITGGAGGNVKIGMSDGVPGEILIMDTDSTETAVNVLRINKAGIGFSHNGYNGPYETAWTLDGRFVANWITSGTLDASLLKIGTITDENGLNFWNLETGEFRLSSSAKIGSGAGAPTIGGVSETANNAASAAAAAQQTADGATTAAGNAQTTANGAATAVATLDSSLNQQGVFNRLTNNGALPGIFMQNWQLYINADYIKAGTLSANLVRAGVLSSEDGLSYWDLDTGEFVTTTSERSVRMTGGYVRIYDSSNVERGSVGTYYISHVVNGNDIQTGARAIGLNGGNVAIGLIRSDGKRTYSIYVNGDSAGVTSPYGYTQRLLFFGSEIHTDPIYFTESCNLRFLTSNAANTSSLAFTIGKFTGNEDGTLTIRQAQQFVVRTLDESTSTAKTLLVFNNGKYPNYSPVIANVDVQLLQAIYLGSHGLKIYQTYGAEYTNAKELKIDADYVHIIGGAVSLVYALYVNGGIQANGPVKCTNVIQSSDERLKNFFEWDSAYDTILDALTPQLYTWKDRDKNTKHIGFSAQKVQKTLKDRGLEDSGIVVEGDDGYLSLNYTEINLLMLNRIKQQQEEIQKLNDKIDALERMVDNLCKFMNCQK